MTGRFGGRRRGGRDGRGRLGLCTAAALVVLVGAYALVLNLSRPHVSGDKLRFDTFVSLANSGRLLSARILDEDAFVVGTYVADAPASEAEGEIATDATTAPEAVGGSAATSHAGHAHGPSAMTPSLPGVASDPGGSTTETAPGTTVKAPAGPVREFNAPVIRGSQSDLLSLLLTARIPITIDQQVKKRVANLASVLLPGLAIIILFVYVILSARRGTGLFAIRSGARHVKVEPGDVRFEDIAGHDSAIADLREISQFLSDPKKFAGVGAEIPKGVLLYGPPGCGKTMLARALAAEAGANFYSISGSDFVELYVGVGASRVRDLFREARENRPAIVFIDEIDSVGRTRSGGEAAQGQTERDQALNQILTEMDGFSSSEGIVVLGATNRPDVLDKALLRPGRFDRSIGLGLPNEEARLAILEVHSKTKTLDAMSDLAPIAARAIGLTGADLASTLNEAALLAARSDRSAIAQEDLDLALQRILEAPEHQRRLSLRNRSIGRRFTDTDRVTFSDVAGQDEAVAQLEGIRAFLTEPARYAAVGGVVPRGVLLYGPPGCGKTLLVRALAGTTNAAFFSVAASEFIEAVSGRGAARIRDLFAEAGSMAPSIVFIDEIDSIGRSRAESGRVGAASPEHEQVLNQLLAEMDGFGTDSSVIVVAATNRPDVLDPALLRPGRFDRTIGLALPDEDARLAILRIHATSRPLEDGVDLARVAHQAIGLTGADLASIMNEAALAAVGDERNMLSMEDLEAAVHSLLQAPERQRRLSLRHRSIGRRFTGEERVTFADVAGVDDAVAELAEVKDYLTRAERYASAGARVPRGILLSGPPGCGKTLLARALAGEANAAFFSVSASEFVQVFAGEGAARVRELFAEARAMAPSILFIDEIDAVGARRSGSQDGARERDQTLNQILVELDGFDAAHATIVLAATNRPDILDPALVRPGRFDRHVVLNRPDQRGRLAILQLHTREKDLADDVDLAALANLTRGFSGADLANLVNEAALLAVRADFGPIPMGAFDDAAERIQLGIASHRTLLTESERNIVVYHESGHALVRMVLPGAMAPHKLSLTSRGGILGLCAVADEREFSVLSRNDLIDEIAGTLGGRVAEQIVFGEPGSGASDDLRRVNGIARRMVCEFGMSEALGPLVYGPAAPPSQDAARAIDAEVRVILDEATRRAHDALSAHRTALDRTAESLLEKESLSLPELLVLLGPVAERKDSRSVS